MSRGGKRQGSGRPGLGIKKTVSLTLTQECWDFLEEVIMKKECSTLSGAIRHCVENEEFEFRKILRVVNGIVD